MSRRVLVGLLNGLKKRKEMSSLVHQNSVRTAGIIIIGDEILKGQVRDSNSHFIISKLYDIGVRVMKVSVIGDDLDEISCEVRKFSRLYTYVITSGGIGPTHDDVTFEGVARAFGETVSPHPELVEICSEFYKTSDLTSPAMKLACVPQSAKLKYGFDATQNCRAKYPNVSVQNVFIFPGVPPLLEKSFVMLCEDLFGGSGTKFHHSELFINEDEVSIAQRLSKAVEEFPTVNFGSYPQYNHRFYRVKLTIEAPDQELLHEAENRLRELLPSSCLFKFDPTPLVSPFEKIESLSSQSGMNHIKVALQEVLQALSGSGLKKKDVVLCIDASHSSLVTLHLMYAVQKKLNNHDSTLTALISNQSSMKTDKFLEECILRYSLQCIVGPTDVKSALSSMQQSYSDIKLLIVGFKYSHSDFQEIVKGQDGHLKVPLLAPVSTWDKTQILQFLINLNLPYIDEECSNS